jgi:hypothetical protein
MRGGGENECAAPRLGEDGPVPDCTVHSDTKVHFGHIFVS